jgi:predicted PurR-regulated permease PerM
MRRGLWFFGEVVVGVLLSGAIAAIASPLLLRTGRDPGPAAVWVILGFAIVASIVVGERLRRGRQRHRLS